MQIFRFTILSLGWVVLSSAAIAQSTWTEQNSGVTSDLRTVIAVSPSVGWAGGDNGTVLRTTDGGTIWNSVGGGIIGTGIIYSIAAVNDSIAFVSTTPSSTYIFRTTDAGKTWTQVYSLNGSFINTIWMLDAYNGIAVGDPVGGKFVVLKTEDSGLSWTRLSTEPNANANEFGLVGSLCIRDNSHIWFGTSNGRVILSTDLGTTWTASTTPLTNVNSVWFNDSLVGLVAGFTSTTAGIAKSTDGGNSWTLSDAFFREVFGDGYEKYFGYGEIQGGAYGVYESPDTSFNWNIVFSPVNGVRDISVGRNNSTNFGWVVGPVGTIARYDEQITNVQGAKTVITSFTLSQNYPNPFNPITNIKYEIAEVSFVTLKVYDVLGNTVATLVNEEKPTGSYEVEFSATGGATELTSGIYFYRLQAGGYVEAKKMILIK